MTGGFLALALLVPAAPAEPPGLQRGTELTFVGSVEEAVERPGVRFRRSQKLEIRVLVLEKSDAWADVAVLTLLRRADDAVAGAVGAVTGATPEKATPPAARLDLVRVHADGTAHHLHPTGPPPFALDAKTPARALPPISLDAFNPFEFGMFPPRPPRTDPEKPWSVAAADPSRPAEVWQLQGTDTVTGERCAVLVANQQHPNWAKPIGGRSAWHRADAVCVSAADGIARKVHRVVRHRDGFATDPAAWVEVKYELKEQVSVRGRTLDRYRRDIETAFSVGAELAPFLADVVKHGPKFFESKGAKLDAYLDSADESSPYRGAVLAVRRQLAAAARGESAAVAAPLGATSKRHPWPEPNGQAPDFTAGTFRLSENRGKPVLLVFFKPGSETTDLALKVADALHQKYAPKAAIVPLAVWASADGPKEGVRPKLTVPVYDGAPADTLYGVESVPRFALIDARGVVRWTFCGVGAETGLSAQAQLERLFAPPSQRGATGTTGAPAPGAAPAPPRP